MGWREQWKEDGGSWFDLVACCYSVILASDNERPEFSALIQDAVSMSDSLVDVFIHSVFEVVSADGLDGRCSRESFDQIGFLYDFYLKDQAWPGEYAEEMGCWAIIAGIDKCVVDSGALRLAGKRGPLNSVLVDEIGVYYKPPISSIDDILSCYGIQYSPLELLSERLQGLNIATCIQAHSLPEIWQLSHSVAQISESDNRLQGEDPTVSPLKLRLGMVACSHDLKIEPGSRDIDVVHMKGGLFGIEYTAAYRDRYEELVGSPLEKAIVSGCHLVVFPEMIMSPQYLEQMKDQLRSTKDTKQLQLVVAGTTWERSCKSEAGTNICYVLDRHGNIQASTSKKHPYINDCCKPHQVECLDSDVDVTTMLDIEGMGRLMVAICKDLETDTDYAYQIATAFRPDALCVPAASGSVKGAFLDRAEIIAKRLHVICCISNLCSKVKARPGADVISLATAPKTRIDESHGRQPDKETVFCKRNISPSGAIECSRANEGCLFIVDVDYGQSAEGFIPTMVATRLCGGVSE